MHKHLKVLAVATLGFVLASCANNYQPAASDSITIMTFNVENLFDTTDDAGKDDATYLPLQQKKSQAHIDGCNKVPVERWRNQCLHYDWNEKVLQKKLSAVARAILQEGNGPDIIALQEVENIAVLERLRTEYLSTSGYKPAILVEGNDLRGIDVAFLTRLETVGTATLHPVGHQGFEQRRIVDTRGILEATFRLPDGNLLTGFAVHFPAPFHPYGMREQAYDALNQLLLALPADRPAFAAGDFNTTTAEIAEHDMMDRYVRDQWQIAHENGCNDCRGTYYYAPRDDWSFLDMILWAKPRGKKTTWGMREGSAKLLNRADGQTDSDGTPQGFELPDATGISDHWPLAVTIEMKAKQ